MKPHPDSGQALLEYALLGAAFVLLLLASGVMTDLTRAIYAYQTRQQDSMNQLWEPCRPLKEGPCQR